MWFRRDLRLSDHPALLAARDDAGSAAGADGAKPLVSWDFSCSMTRCAARRGRPGSRFSTAACGTSNEQLDGRLVVRRGDPVKVVPAVAREAGAHDGSHQRRLRALRQPNVTVAWRPRWRRTAAGWCEPDRPTPWRRDASCAVTASPYRVFTPFSRAWRAARLARAGVRPRAVDWLAARRHRDSEGSGARARSSCPTAGEHAAHERLDASCKSVDGLRDGRDRPAAEAHVPALAVSEVRLHPPAHHPGQAPVGGKGRRDVRERAGLARVLRGCPVAPAGIGARETSATAWPGSSTRTRPRATAPRHFEAWKQGRTGYPIVDAGMRQLLAEGWMHNRVRMITASFLVKDLHIWWRPGARWFLEQLVDGDLASNNHGWQWVAGTGTDAAPYFRVFNPVLQGEKFDPGRRLRAPLRARAAGRRGQGGARAVAADGGPPNGYPAPIVDHAAERKDGARAATESVRGGHQRTGRRPDHAVGALCRA